jgi:hypothetical protein
MEAEEALLALEEQFWKEDATFYREHLTADAVLVFPDPVGVLTKEETVQAVAEAPRWARVRMSDVRVVRLADDAAVLTYRAEAERDAQGSRYEALASSAYVFHDASWKLAFHQQTPV